MSHKNNLKKPDPLVISRVFPASRQLVFKAWSSAAHLQRWYCPEHLTVPYATVDFQPGGQMEICMQKPDGQRFWSRGNYIEIVPPERLVFSLGMIAGSGEQRFTALTTVSFEDFDGGTRMTVRQEYDIHDETVLFAIEGAPEGWRTTLDKLEREVARLQSAAAADAVTHATFSIARTYPATPASVFHALTDPAAKARWFGGGDEQTIIASRMDVRPGGREYVQGRWASGTVSTFDAVYFDVTPDQRLVYAYEMHIDDRKISVSLATVELKPEGDGTKLTVTEQGAFLNGYDDAGSREHGTSFLLDRLGATLPA